MIGVVSYNIIEFINYYLTYVILFNVRFTSKKIRYLLVFCVSILVNLLVYLFLNRQVFNIVTTFMGAFAVIVLTTDKRYKVLLIFPFVYFISSLINLSGSYVLASVIKVNPEYVYESPLLTFISECTAVIVLLVWSKVNRNKTRREIKLSPGQYILALVGIICLLFVVGFVQGLIVNEFEFLIEIKGKLVIFTTVLAFCFLGLNFVLYRTWKDNALNKMENEKYEVFLNQQESYIKTIILEDERRRKIRHDMNAHILAMSVMLENKQYEELDIYFNNLKEKINESDIRKYTGVIAVDSIISELFNRARENAVICTWDGGLNLECKATVFELCVIFSNLLANAVEELEQLGGERKLDVYVKNIGDGTIIKVGNSCRIDTVVTDRPISKKGDSAYHGLGLRNVEDVVDKYKGSIKYHGESGWFEVEIVL